MNEDSFYDYSDEAYTYEDNIQASSTTAHPPMTNVFQGEKSKLTLNNGWNTQIEHDARLVGEKSGGLRWMHNKASSVFLKRYWIVTGINIFLSAVVVAFNSVTGGECINNTLDPYRVVSIVGGALIGIVTTYSSIKNYGARVTAHQVSEGNFQALFYTIKNQLHLNREDRQFGKDFIEWVQKEYTDLSSNPDSPNIPGFVEKDYTELIKDSDIAKYNDIEPIVIKQDSPPRPPKPSNDRNDVPRTHSRARPKSRSVNPRTRLGPHRRRNASRTRARSHVTNRPRPNTDGVENYTITIPDNTELSAKERWQLSRFYGNK